jgi:TPR repeat protein
MCRLNTLIVRSRTGKERRLNLFEMAVVCCRVARVLARAASMTSLVVSISGGAQAGPFEDAATAYEMKDYSASATLLRPIAEGGLAAAQHNLGFLYEKGRGVPQDYAEAARWYRKAADQRYLSSMFKLARLYSFGLGVPQDYAEAERLHVAVAEMGGPLAQFNLGVIYSQGWHLPQDYEKAIHWYRRAAEHGEPQAQFNLGVACIKGLGSPRDYDEAIVWYQRAARQGYGRAQVNLGTMYAAGAGVPQSKVEAHKWYSLAIVRLPLVQAPGDQDYVSMARRLRRELASTMTADEIKEADRLVEDWRPVVELTERN